MRTREGAYTVDSSRLPIIEVSYDAIPTIAEFREGHVEFVRIIRSYRRPIGFLINLAGLPRQTVSLGLLKAASQIFAEFAPQIRPYAVAEARVVDNAFLRGMTTAYDRLRGTDRWPVRSFGKHPHAIRWLEQAIVTGNQDTLPARRFQGLRTQHHAIEVMSDRLPIVDVHYRSAPTNEEIREAFEEFMRIAAQHPPVLFLIRFDGFPVSTISPARLLGLANIQMEYMKRLEPFIIAEARIVKSAGLRALSNTLEAMTGGDHWPVRTFGDRHTAEGWLQRRWAHRPGAL